jgi:flagellar biosynthesis protein FlhF
MHTIPFIADSAAEAVAQIRAQLGPDAMVVSMRPVPARGLTRFWKKPRVEILAGAPEPASVADAVGQLREELRETRRCVEALKRSTGEGASDLPRLDASTLQPFNAPGDHRAGPVTRSPWRVASILEGAGLLPVHVERLLDDVRVRHGGMPPASLGDEIALVREAFAARWRPAPPVRFGERRPHVLIGPAGSGKTTALAKWLAHTVLIEGAGARIWRLDGTTANTAEFLTVHGEVLSVAVDRTWTSLPPAEPGSRWFIDLPGVDWRDAAAVAELGRLLQQFGTPRLHLVLNGAYEAPLLLAQARAFAGLPVDDVIVTHLDEEPRWGKLWNLVLGTPFPLRFLGAGQNVPGEFVVASAEKLFARQFPR